MSPPHLGTGEILGSSRLQFPLVSPSRRFSPTTFICRDPPALGPDVLGAADKRYSLGVTMNIIAAMDNFDLSCLSDAATFVDSKLDFLEERAKQSRDPDSDGIYDRAEYLAGLGFVACQAYLSESLSLSDLDRDTGLNLGPRHASDHSMVTLVNAIANYWKHAAEWTYPLSRRAQTTADLIASLGVNVDSSYVVVNSLSELVRPHHHRIKYLLPFLSQWRAALHNAA